MPPATAGDIHKAPPPPDTGTAAMAPVQCVRQAASPLAGCQGFISPRINFQVQAQAQNVGKVKGREERCRGASDGKALRRRAVIARSLDAGKENGAPPSISREIEDEGELLVSSFARVDTDREARTGFPEVVWGPGKTAVQIASILEAMSQRQPIAMATRIEPSMYEQVLDLLPGVVYHTAARILTYQSNDASCQQETAERRASSTSATIGSREYMNLAASVGSDSAPDPLRGASPASPFLANITIVSAGTADLPVAEEARVTAEVMGISTTLVADVGVAGLHRLLNQIERIRKADVVIVVAGTDGALPSVVAGLVESPVIAVPTSIGYGASFGGVAALLTMLNSCAPGLTVVNIDNGFGAALAAGRIARKMKGA